jgi:glucuronate isomerase
MKPFLDGDFLLESEIAIDLYRRFAAPQPILDYHNHLSPQQIADDHRFATITELWLEGDHYKWRAMRAAGVPEREITGDASDWDKFAAWAATVPQTLRNPLYHWTHMELRALGAGGKRLSTATAAAVFDSCNAALMKPELSAQGLLRRFDVRVVCTTDDPIDDLAAHERHARNKQAFTKLYPTWRPDRLLAVRDLRAWNGWVDALGAAAGISIGSVAALRDALSRRHDRFHALGCRASDHGLKRLSVAPVKERELGAIFAKARAGKGLLGPDEVEQFRSGMSHDLAVMDHGRGWVQQFHLGALRDVSTRGFRALGAAAGYDAIGDFRQGETLARFLDRLDEQGKLAKTIVYNLNPGDTELFATIVAAFNDGSVPGKMQLGSAWWFLDQLDGMRRQLDAVSNMGLLSRFVGMLTDSRSLLSFSRHDYFRRLLCNLLGDDVVRGRLPDDRDLLGGLVADVCYGNARRYFEFPL